MYFQSQINGSHMLFNENDKKYKIKFTDKKAINTNPKVGTF